MIEITPRFALPLDLPTGKEDLEAPEFRLALEESELSGPAPGTHLDPTASGKALFGGLPQSQFFYADPNGAGGTGTPGVRHGQTSSGSIGGRNPPALQLGSSGPAVRTLQHELNKWRAEQRPKLTPIAENGRFTPETKSAVEDFQKANQIQTGTGTKLHLTPDGIADVRVQNRLRLENDPAFQKLLPDSKDLARKVLILANRDGAPSVPLLTLLADPSFQKTGAQAQYDMLAALATRPADLESKELRRPDTELVAQYTKLANRPEFQKLDPSIQATVIDQVTRAARPPVALPGTDPEKLFQTKVDNLTRLATSASFAKLAPDDQRLALRAAAHDPSDTKLGSAIRSLLSDPDFGSLKPEEKNAVLSQVANYPDDRAINNINRMLAKDWFQDQDLDNKQRSLKTIADLSSHQGDRTIIDNTLERLLSENSDIKLKWATPTPDRIYGEGDASTRTLTLNPRYVPEGNDRVPDNDDGKHLVLHTVAHEVNHILNNDVPRPSSFQHFEQEYRAFAVGFKAEHGHWPTNKDAMERVRYELTAKDGGYQDIKGAIGKFHDGMAIIRFLEQITGLPVNAGNIDDILKSDPDTWANRSRNPDERGMKQSDRLAPLADGNIDNSEADRE
jgi:peptidoglycan hydrolase-like protein with peptidoglycan-binding domain